MKKIINVKKLGLKDDGTLQTKKFQQIINEHSRKDNIIYFPKGEYVLSTVYLRNNTHIFVSRDAKILGSKNFYDFDKDEKVDYPLYQDPSHSFFHSSLFVGENVKNISICGTGTIDMQSVWDEDNVRNIVHRGCKVIALKYVDHFHLSGLRIYNATDLAVYFAGCNFGLIEKLKLKVYIDGISPDNSKHIQIRDCYVESGDDGIVFKSSYTLNKLDICEDIRVNNCKIKSRCNSLKFGTETNGGFRDIKISNCYVFNSRITGISVESVDGGFVEDISFKNIVMKNVGSPFFVHLNKRLRGPKGSTVGSINNVRFENIKVLGPYKVYKCMPWNYVSYINKDTLQFPGYYSGQKKEKTGTWQITSNVCGLKEKHISNIVFKNIYMELDGGVIEFDKNVPEEAPEYPEVCAYGKILPAAGIYFRYCDNPIIENVKIKLLNIDNRPAFIFD